MLKRDIRISILDRRRTLSITESLMLDKAMARRFAECTLPMPGAVHRYMAAPGRNEPDPGPLVEWLRTRNPGLREMAPRIVPGTDSLESFYITADTVWKKNMWGIPEPVDGAMADPSEADMVFLPLLSFDTNGHRVGYGKGYYDRFLATCRGDSLRIGLSWFGPVDRIEDLAAHDIPMHYCITPERVYTFHED
jgi:5-formyltetrahydrofolate cyclo-ligase